jgi:hypothetical protein
LLEAHESLRDAFFNVNVFDRDGKLVASLRDRNARRVNISERQYFKDTMRLQEGVISALQKLPVGTAGGGADAAAARCRRQTDRHPAGRDRPVAPLVLGPSWTPCARAPTATCSLSPIRASPCIIRTRAASWKKR